MNLGSPSKSTMFHTKFIRREDIAAGTIAFHFARPVDFKFKAGQTVDIILIDPPETDAEGNSRTFSIASAPSDPDIVIGTRLRDTAFKRVLKNMEPGAEVMIDGPFGSFTLHNDLAKPAVFLAGGIGITPFRSILREAAAQKLPHRIFLFWSNRRPEDSPWRGEFVKREARSAQREVILTMTEPEKSTARWTGETGYITAEMMRKYLPDFTGAIFYLAGPPQMVFVMRDMLDAAGVDDVY